MSEPTRGVGLVFHKREETVEGMSLFGSLVTYDVPGSFEVLENFKLGHHYAVIFKDVRLGEIYSLDLRSTGIAAVKPVQAKDDGRGRRLEGIGR